MVDLCQCGLAGCGRSAKRRLRVFAPSPVQVRPASMCPLTLLNPMAFTATKPRDTRGPQTILNILPSGGSPSAMHSARSHRRRDACAARPLLPCVRRGDKEPLSTTVYDCLGLPRGRPACCRACGRPGRGCVGRGGAAAMRVFFCCAAAFAARHSAAIRSCIIFCNCELSGVYSSQSAPPQRLPSAALALPGRGRKAQ